LQPVETYLGMSDSVTEGVWIWADSGVAATYKNWAAGQPNGWLTNNCALIDTSGKWANVMCEVVVLQTVTYPIVCERLIWR
jgi:hypothetical protein